VPAPEHREPSAALLQACDHLLHASRCSDRHGNNVASRCTVFIAKGLDYRYAATRHIHLSLSADEVPKEQPLRRQACQV
jgi:hypothetical protein